VKKLNVLVGFEFSGTVRDAFIKEGHNAISCDLLPTESPGPHYQGDIYDILTSREWDIICLHPPCTALAVSGNGTYGYGKPKYKERLRSVEWTVNLWNTAKKYSKSVCLENPRGVLSTMGGMPKATFVQPYEYGHGETKLTCLWLHNLPKLKPTNIVEGRDQRIWKMPPSKDRGKLRSIFYPGIAEAMAKQWGSPEPDLFSELDK